MKIRTGRIFALPAAMAFFVIGACAHADSGQGHAGHTVTTPTAGGAVTTPAVQSSAQPQMIHADVLGLDGKPLGMVMLQETAAGVLVSVDVQGLPVGEHGFHFHQKGICEPAAKFDTSGGHFAGGDHQHGYMTVNGPHGGDMPNQHVGADGILKAQILNTGVTFGSGIKSLFDADGTALVIHAAADDYSSQPSGNAGARIACAVISVPK